MPVVIAPEDHDRWLNGPDPADLLKPFPADGMVMWPVSPKLNSPKNDSADLLDEFEPDEPIEGANEGEADREPTNSE